MSNFSKAVKIILTNEGGYTVDHAGPTKYGITYETLKRHDPTAIVAQIEFLTRSEASEIYKKLWWDRYQYDNIANWRTATKVFDISVNMGHRQGHKLAQRACRSCGIIIDDDGILGPISFRTINSVEYKQYLTALRSETAGFYRGLVMKNKEKYGKYLNGWLNRAYQ